MMRNRFVAVLAGGGILLIGMVLGALLSGVIPALASPGGGTPTASRAANGQYCQLFEETLANNLHVSQSQLQGATQDALRTTIQQAYKDGKITQTQETTLLNRVSQLGAHPCAGLGRFADLAGGHPGAAKLAGARQAVVSAVASTLKLPAATLEADLKAGQTIAQIAAAQHVALGDVNQAYLGTVQAQLKAAVASGTMTQQESDQVSAKIQQAVTNGHYPLLEAGHRGKP